MAIFAPGLFLSQAYLLAQLTVCPPGDTAPHVDVFFVPQKPLYITEAPVKALTQALAQNKDATHQDTAKTGKWRVFGITEGRMEGTNYQASYNGLTDQQGNKCIYVDKITFVVRYKPTIFIGAELKKHECHFKVTKLHEERHVATDLRVIRQYLPKIKMEILRFLWRYGPQGPYPAQESGKQASRILEEVVTAVQPMVDKLFEERRKHQGDIDTIENYKYESGLCPGEWPKVE